MKKTDDASKTLRALEMLASAAGATAPVIPITSGRKSAKVPPQSASEEANDEIQIGPDLDHAIKKAIKHLPKQHPDLFALRGKLVRALGGKLIVLARQNLAALSSTATRWTKWDEDEERWVPARPDRQAIQAIMTQQIWEGIPEIESVVSAPVWLGGSELLCKPGWHARTRLYYQGEPFDDARRREPTADLLAELLDLIGEFPFSDEPSRAASLGYLFSLLMQYGYDPPTPLHVLSAKHQAAGKGLLLSTIVLLATGSEVIVTPYPRNDEELKKVALSHLRTGTTRAVLWDEVSRVIGGAGLRSLVTAGKYGDRALCTNDMLEAVNRTVWAVLGNMLALGDDMSRRSLAISLELQTRKTFKYPHLKRHILEHRPRLLGAAFELIRRWVEAGAPGPHGPLLASFESWSMHVEGLCEWLGLASLQGAREHILNVQAEEQADVFAIVEAACARFAVDEVSCAEIKQLESDPAWKDRFDSAFGENSGVKGGIPRTLRTTQVGKDGTKLVRGAHTKRWRVERARCE